MKRTALCISDAHLGIQAAVRKDKKRISSTNGQERLNMEIRRRSRVVGVFPSVESYVRLTICYLIEYAEDWASERSYIREDKVLGSLDRLHELMAQAAN
jgi:putative transposase